MMRIIATRVRQQLNKSPIPAVVGSDAIGRSNINLKVRHLISRRFDESDHDADRSHPSDYVQC